MISANALIAEARTATGLSDFGDDWFFRPLDALVGFVNAEAGLKAPAGGPVDRILAALIDRLKLVDLLKRKPAILDERIEVAGAIIGLPRTGSTLLHRLLAASPQLTAPFWWETTFPLPLDGEAPGDPSARQALAKKAVDDLLKYWPDFESIDPIDAMEVAEEVILLDKGFLSTTYDSIMAIPGYGRWQRDEDQTRAYAELKIWLQVLQHHAPWRRGRKWILKTPHHLLGGMGGLMKVFPEATLIMTHRDPAEVLPSYCSMCASMTASSSTTYRREAQGAAWTERFATGLKRFAALRRTLPAGKVVDVRYEETAQDPLAAGARVLAAIGLDFGPDEEAAMRAAILRNARENRPKHRYAAADFGLSPEGIAAAFSFYTEHRS